MKIISLITGVVSTFIIISSSFSQDLLSRYESYTSREDVFKFIKNLNESDLITLGNEMIRKSYQINPKSNEYLDGIFF